MKTRRGGCYSCFMVAGAYAVMKLVAVSWRASDCVDTQNLVRMALRCYGATGRQQKARAKGTAHLLTCSDEGMCDIVRTCAVAST